MSMRCWCLVLQTLTLCCNHTPHDPSPLAPATAADQYDNVDLVSPVLLGVGVKFVWVWTLAKRDNEGW